MDTLRVGFAGAGFIAGIHAEVLSRDPRVRVHAVIDPDLQRVTAFALNTGATVVPSLDDLLGEIDALYICTPNALHADTAVHALDAGVAVFSEKPMATSLDAARAVFEAAARASCVYQVGFNRRFAGVYRELKHRVESGDITPTSALLKMNRGELQRPAWTADPLMTGGFLYETPVHMLDLVRHLFGEPVEVVCRARATVYDQLDDFSMLFSFASGMSAVLASSAHATWLYPFERVEVYGEHASIVTEEMERISFSTGVEQAALTIDFAQQPRDERWGYIEADGRFVDALCGVGESAVGAAEALATTALVERCYAAARDAAPTALTG